MKITDIETIVLQLLQVLPNGDGLQGTLIIKVYTDEGVVGLGELSRRQLLTRQFPSGQFKDSSNF